MVPGFQTNPCNRGVIGTLMLKSNVYLVELPAASGTKAVQQLG